MTTLPLSPTTGDNVGDVAGMGADLFESYVGAIISAGALAVAAGMGLSGIHGSHGVGGR